MKQLVLKLWSARYEFAKYFAIGISGVILDIASLYALKQYLHFSATEAVITNQLVLINYSFFLNKHWAFKSKGVTKKQMMKFYLLGLFNYCISITWMWTFTENWPLHNYIAVPEKTAYLLVRTANIALAVAWNFLLYKFWVYKVEEPKQA